MPPPVLDPKSLRIIQNLETTLVIPDGDDPFYFDFAAARTIKAGGPHDVTEYPTVLIMPRGSNLETLSHKRDITSFIDLITVIETGDDPVGDVEKALSDVETALMQDNTRGGLAQDTHVESWVPDYPMDEGDVIAWVTIRIRIDYRTTEFDLTT